MGGNQEECSGGITGFAKAREPGQREPGRREPGGSCGRNQGREQGEGTREGEGAGNRQVRGNPVKSEGARLAPNTVNVSMLPWVRADPAVPDPPRPSLTSPHASP